MLKCRSLNIEQAKRMDLRNYHISQKLDGFRAFFTDNQIFSERGINNTHKFPQIMKELKEIDEKIILDGEIALNENSRVFDVNRKSNWRRCNYYIFDVLHFGNDLRNLSFNKRQDILEEFVLPFRNHLKLPQSFENLDKAWEEVVSKDYEGLVIKQKFSPYPKTNLFQQTKGSWYKIKHTKETRLVFTEFEEHPSGCVLCENDLRINLGNKQLSQLAMNEINTAGSVCANVEFLYQNPSGKYFQPRITQLIIKGIVIK